MASSSVIISCAAVARDIKKRRDNMLSFLCLIALYFNIFPACQIAVYCRYHKECQECGKEESAYDSYTHRNPAFCSGSCGKCQRKYAENRCQACHKDGAEAGYCCLSHGIHHRK